MKQEKIRFWNSIVSRFALFFTGLNILAILISGYLVYNQAATVITSHSKERMEYTSNLATQSFYSLLNEVANDIAVISKNPVLRHFIDEATLSNQEDLHDLFSVVLENKASYFQIRLLDVNHNGKEIVRYDKTEGQILRTPHEKLQYKGDRAYFQEALKLPRNSYYYSEINLNEEFGTVSYPLTPTLRAVGQVYDKYDSLRSFIVINVDLSGFYEELNQITESELQLMIINASGDYLFTYDMDKCFGSQLGTSASFINDFRQDISTLMFDRSDGFIRNNSQVNFLYHVETINYSQGEQIYLVALLEDDLLFRSAYMVRNDSFKTVLLVCLTTLIIVFLFTSIFSKNIIRITEAVTAYEKGVDPGKGSQLPKERRDELGVLARSFARMRNRIDQQLSDLKAALGREQMAIKEKNQFLQNMSHELRTPLNAILGLTQLLNKNNPGKEQQPIIDSLERSATNLSGLMYDILDHQKLMEGKVKLDLSPQVFYDLLSDVYGSYQYHAVNKGLDFKLEIDHKLKHNHYLTDVLRFNQIITNLVVNAIKYTDKGVITLKAVVINDQKQTLEVVVSDTGKGILPENLKKIRKRFYREKEDIQEKREGFGLGLSIVIQLVELFGGSLKVTSEIDHGSQFRVHLPLIPVKSSQVKPTNKGPKEALPPLNGSYSVLHIEDDPSTLLMVSHVLELPAVTLHHARTIEKAMEVTEAHPPHLILSDLMLNNQVIDTALLNIPGISQTPLMLLSAFETKKMAEISPYFIQKPFDLDHLRNMVVMLLGRHEYDEPQLQPVYQQYDDHPQKIRNFLSILQREFSAYLERFELVFETGDSAEWTAITHKLTTHIKSLKLVRLSGLIPEHPSQLDPAKMEAIKNALLYCLCVFRFQSQLRAGS